MTGSHDDRPLRLALNDLADQLCVAVDGNFDFAVRSLIEDETLEKVGMLINFVLDTARRGSVELEDRVRIRTRELESAQERLRQAQKIEALGLLAAGIAHDFNNILSVILSYASLILDDVKEDNPLRADVSEIRSAGQRAAALTRQLLAFSRQQVLEPRVLDLNTTLANMESMIRRLLGARLRLRMAMAPGLWKVRADPSQIEQIIMNLVVNARDAMPDGGMLTIETRNVAPGAGATDSPRVLLAVVDTGLGIDRTTLAKVFDPFFTTKPQGQGTGLGLAMVAGIVEQHKGTICVQSEPGAGARLEVYLPCSDEIPATSASIWPSLALATDKTVLLVEDEDAVRVVVRNILTRSGYRVLEAPHPGAAILECEQFAGTVHLLLTDVVMPQMGGRELAERLGRMRPEMKVLLMSGYTDDVLARHGVFGANVAFLQKPVTPRALLQKISEILAGA